MNFIQRILNTKKVKDLKKKLESNPAVSKTVDFIEEKSESVKEKIAEVGDKIEARLDGKISFDTFQKVEMKVGEILSAEKVDKSDKLLKLEVFFGENDKRQVVSGIYPAYEPKKLKGKKAIFVVNLEPREIFSLKSEAMILGLRDKEGNFTLLTPEKDCEAGEKVG